MKYWILFLAWALSTMTCFYQQGIISHQENRIRRIHEAEFHLQMRMPECEVPE